MKFDEGAPRRVLAGAELSDARAPDTAITSGAHWLPSPRRSPRVVVLLPDVTFDARSLAHDVRREFAARARPPPASTADPHRPPLVSTLARGRVFRRRARVRPRGGRGHDRAQGDRPDPRRRRRRRRRARVPRRHRPRRRRQPLRRRRAGSRRLARGVRARAPRPRLRRGRRSRGRPPTPSRHRPQRTDAGRLSRPRRSKRSRLVALLGRPRRRGGGARSRRVRPRRRRRETRQLQGTRRVPRQVVMAGDTRTGRVEGGGSCASRRALLLGVRADGRRRRFLRPDHREHDGSPLAARARRAAAVGGGCVAALPGD